MCESPLPTEQQAAHGYSYTALKLDPMEQARSEHVLGALPVRCLLNIHSGPFMQSLKFALFFC